MKMMTQKSISNFKYQIFTDKYSIDNSNNSNHHDKQKYFIGQLEDR